MKNKMFLCIFLFSCFQLFSVELWNGFYSEMNISQVKTHATELFDIDKMIEQTDRVNNGFSTPTSFKDYDFPTIALVLKIKIRNDGYAQNVGYNINFAFYKEKLISIEIVWISENLENIARNNYGNPTRLLIYTVLNNTTRPMWALPGKDFIISGRATYYVDRNLLEEYREERRQEKLRGELEERQQRERADSRVIL